MFFVDFPFLRFDSNSPGYVSPWPSPNLNHMAKMFARKELAWRPERAVCGSGSAPVQFMDLMLAQAMQADTTLSIETRLPSPEEPVLGGELLQLWDKAVDGGGHRFRHDHLRPNSYLGFPRRTACKRI